MSEVRKKVVWIVAQHAMPPQYESRLRNIKFAHYFAEAGYEVKIFASSVMHNMDVDLIEGNEKYIERTYGDIHFVHIKTRKYRGNGLARIVGMFQFSRRFVQTVKHFATQPDIIIGGSVPFGLGIRRYADKVGAVHIVQVQDLWPLSFVELGLIGARNPVTRVLYGIEKRLYAKADAVVFSMQGGADYIRDKKWDTEHGGPIDLRKVHYINSGVDLKDFDEYKSRYVIEDDDLNAPDIKKVVYIGSIRLANNIGSLIDAAALLTDRKDVKFLIYGDGGDRPVLEKRVRDEGLSNVVFKEKWIEPVYVPYVLSKSYLNILNYKSGSFGTYGGSQSKMFQYMASGKPICCNLKMMYCPIKHYDIGIAEEFGSVREYADAIRRILDMDRHTYEAVCRRARIAAEDFNYPNLASEMMRLMEKLLIERRGNKN